MRVLPVLLISPLLLGLAAPSYAALKTSGSGNAAPVSAQDASNPKPAPGDIVLPMPEGYTMVFRAVSIPLSGALYDKRFNMGLPSTDKDRSIYERRTDAYIGAPFEQSDLPASWAKELPPNEKDGFRYYFIGKYEITNGQWKAVMGGDSGGGANLPKTGVTWYEIQDFLNKYNTWLMKNHAAELPVLEGMPAYLRLPSEEEWEFAARGGSLPPEKANFSEFYLDKGKTIADYAVFGDRYDNPMPVGTKRPNNLGLYDMAGNAAEMMQSLFRFTIADSDSNGNRTRRLHGAEGGLIVKGGSFLSSSEKDVLPGRRNEMRMFVRSEAGGFTPFSARHVGARLVISSINVPGKKRQDELLQEASSMSGNNELKPATAPTPDAAPAAAPAEAAKPNTAPDPVKTAAETDKAPKSAKAEDKDPDRLIELNPNGNPLTELDKVIESAGSPFMQSNLFQLRDILEDQNQALERERDENLTSNVRSAVYKANDIRNLAWRCWYMGDALRKAESKLKQRPQEYKKYRERIENFYHLLETSTDHYRSSVESLSRVPEDRIRNKIQQMKKEYSGEDLVNKAMFKNTEVLERHADFARRQGIDELTIKQVWRDLIMPQMLEEIESIYNHGTPPAKESKKKSEKK